LLRCLEEILQIHRSTGYISQVIEHAQQQATAFLKQVAYQTTGAGILDELFMGEAPILIAVEPNSTAIIMLVKEIHRDGDTWGLHLLQTEEQGFKFNLIASDQAQGIATGVNEALGENVPHQIDIGHLFAQVSQLDAALERAAYKSLAYEEERWRVLDSARSAQVLSKRIQAWEQAKKASEQTIDLYDDFHYLAHQLYDLFTPVDSEGVPTTLADVQVELEALIALLSELPSARAQQVCTRLDSQKEGLLVFFCDFQQCLKKLHQLIPDEELLQMLLLEYFLNRKKKLSESCQKTLTEVENFLSSYLGPKADFIRKQVACILDGLLRSSALVENANSRIRPYLNLRKGVSQGFLDLLALYLNSKTYRRGKRQGQTPFELLGVYIPDDWLELLGLPRN